MLQNRHDSTGARSYHGGMVDKLTQEQRSWNMSRIRCKDTKPELIVRSLLHRMGFRFRVNRKDLPGKPDLTLAKYRTVIFVHGCFWHRHKHCKGATTPSTRREFWEKKFNGNVARDRRNSRKLQKEGWKVLILWECEVVADPIGIAMRTAKALGRKAIEYPLPSRREILKVAENRAGNRLSPSGYNSGISSQKVLTKPVDMI